MSRSMCGRQPALANFCRICRFRLQEEKTPKVIKRTAVLIYGVASYLVFFCTFLYAAGFVGNLWVPKSIDSGAEGSLTEALIVNCSLLTVFALQHSIMARKWFKEAWTRIVPPAMERSTYVLCASLALILMFTAWRPMGGVIWSVEAPAGQMILWAICVTGWLTVLASTFLINHFDLFGLRQVVLYFMGKPYTHLGFRTPVLYKYVRHPIYLGFLLAFWATPVMTAAHLVFALATTGYILTAIQFEERDLIREHGETYSRYRKATPMLLPVGGQNMPAKGEAAHAGQSA